MNPFNAARRLTLGQYEVRDPGDGGALTGEKQFAVFQLESGATAQTRTQGAPQRAGLHRLIVLNQDGGGDITLTVSAAYDLAGGTTFVFATEGDWVYLVSCKVNDVLVWRLMATGGNAARATKTARIPFRDLRVHDAMGSALPAAATADDMGVVTGTPGTNAPTVQGVDFGGTTSDEKCAFEFVLPEDYVAGTNLTLRAFAGMLTAISDGTATLDCEAWSDDGDGTVSSDLCATAAISINSLTVANRDFTITGTNLSPGDKLLVRLSYAGSDTGNLAVMIPAIQKLEVRYTAKI